MKIKSNRLLAGLVSKELNPSMVHLVAECDRVADKYHIPFSDVLQSVVETYQDFLSWEQGGEHHGPIY